MSELLPVRRCVSALLVTPDGQLVIQLRDDRPGLLFRAHWATLGGAIEDGETPDEAMKRELTEEIEPAPPVSYWRTIEHHFEAYGVLHTVENHIYVGNLLCPLEDVKLYEGRLLAAFSSNEIFRLPIAYGLETVFRSFFAEYRSDLPI